MVAPPDGAVAVSTPPTFADLAAAPGELVASCQDCHHNTTMPVAALLPRYAAETPFPDLWVGTWTFGPTGRPAKRQDRSPRHSRLDRLRAELTRARRPWWRRLIGLKR